MYNRNWKKCKMKLRCSFLRCKNINLAFGTIVALRNNNFGASTFPIYIIIYDFDGWFFLLITLTSWNLKYTHTHTGRYTRALNVEYFSFLVSLSLSLSPCVCASARVCFRCSGFILRNCKRSMHDQAMKKTSIQDYVEWNDVLSLKGERIKREKRRRTNERMYARSHARKPTNEMKKKQSSTQSRQQSNLNYKWDWCICHTHSRLTWVMVFTMHLFLLDACAVFCLHLFYDIALCISWYMYISVMMLLPSLLLLLPLPLLDAMMTMMVLPSLTSPPPLLLPLSSSMLLF